MSSLAFVVITSCTLSFSAANRPSRTCKSSRNFFSSSFNLISRLRSSSCALSFCPSKRAVRSRSSSRPVLCSCLMRASRSRSSSLSRTDCCNSSLLNNLNSLCCSCRRSRVCSSSSSLCFSCSMRRNRLGVRVRDGGALLGCANVWVPTEIVVVRVSINWIVSIPFKDSPLTVQNTKVNDTGRSRTVLALGAPCKQP